MKIFILCCLLLSAGSVFAQAQSPNEDVRKSFNEINDWVLKSADMVPADKYSYKPVDTVRTFGQLVAHIADSYNYFCARGAGRQVEWVTPIENGNTDKDTVLPKLKEAIGRCNATYSAANAQFGPLMVNVGHTSLHYGNMITYMRMIGLKPRSS